MTDEAKRYVRKAEHALEVAEDLMKAAHPSDAASKIALDTRKSRPARARGLKHCTIPVPSL